MIENDGKDRGKDHEILKEEWDNGSCRMEDANKTTSRGTQLENAYIGRMTWS